jgi:pyrroline-5-carboxylate reductase
LTVCDGLGRVVDESEIVGLASVLGLEGWDEVVLWARARQPQGLTIAQRDSYVAQASTPGGVTEALVAALKGGRSLTDSLRSGVARSDELAEM